jgi:hypothetical protein
MDGPWHYTEAEKLAVQAQNMTKDAEQRAAIAAIAQVHATLALVASTQPGGLPAGWNAALQSTAGDPQAGRPRIVFEENEPPPPGQAQGPARPPWYPPES